MKPAPRTAEEAVLAALPRGDLLLGYQARTLAALRSGASLLVIEKSRRIGLTWALGAYAVLKAAAGKAEGGMDAWYMGYDHAMAREFIRVCAMWARAFGIAAEAVGEGVLEDGPGQAGVQTFSMTFASGFKITALPSVARALRGKQGLVIVDEAAFHGDLLEVLKAAMALLIWGGQVVVVSTHDGVANAFNQLLDDIRAGARKGAGLTITFDDAIADGLYERVAAIAAAKREDILSKADWIADIRAYYGDNVEEELDCVPKQGKGSWIDAGDLAACEHEDAGKPELYAGGLVYLGRDVARRRDLSVIHAFELVGDVLWMRERWIGRGVSFAEQDDAAAAMFGRYRVASYAIDQTGMGEKVVEDEQRRYGSSRCQGVLLTGPNRLDLATAFKDRTERTLIRIPPLPALRADYRAIKKQGGPAGAVRLVNEGEVHADEFWATGLACRGAATPYQAYAYRGLRAGDPATQRALRDAPGRSNRAGFSALRRGLY